MNFKNGVCVSENKNRLYFFFFFIKYFIELFFLFVLVGMANVGKSSTFNLISK
jgi:GTP-binding protein EngB required for normal cell division